MEDLMTGKISNYLGAPVVIFTLLVSCFLREASADLLCIKKKLTTKGSTVAHAKALLVRSSSCPKGYTQLLDTSVFKGEDGAAGAPGQNGADATALLYGTGSAGDLSITSGSETLDDPNLNYEDISIAAGATLNLRSGTILRCTGSFNNEGTLNIYSFSKGGLQALPGSSTISPKSTSPMASGLTAVMAANGECGTNAASVSGGWGGNSGIVNASPLFTTLTRFGRIGGGGGGCSSGSTSANAGAEGGGVAYVLCGGALNNSGTIQAKGRNAPVGAGGGGGGVIILGSATSIVNAGTLSVVGGTGGASEASRGAGGGGAGGAIFLISPSIVEGTTEITGGAAGSNATAITQSPRCGGGGGGPSLSWGGDGGSVATNGTANAASAGQDGDVQSITADPADILHNL